MVARRQGLKDGGGRSHARGKKRRLRAMFQACQHGLGLIKSGVVGAGVNAPAAVLVVGVANVGRGDVNGRHHGARLFVNPAQGLGGNGGGVDGVWIHGEQSLTLTFYFRQVM